MRHLVIGLAGGSGSGKTTFGNNLIERLGEDTVLLYQHDAYYYDLSLMPDPDPANINYDHPASLETSLCAEHLRELKAGRSIRQPIYDFSTHRRLPETRLLEAKPVILVEGILVLAEAELTGQMDLKVFVDAEPDIRLLRRMERDIDQRGRSVQSVRDQYCATVRPMFNMFVAPSRAHADIIVPHGGENSVALDVITGFIESELRQRTSANA